MPGGGWLCFVLKRSSQGASGCVEVYDLGKCYFFGDGIYSSCVLPMGLEVGRSCFGLKSIFISF